MARMKPAYWLVGVLMAAVLVLLCGMAWRFLHNPDPPFIQDELEHFKYGSIGAEVNGYPYLVWRELPTLFARELPKGWQTFGFLHEPGRQLPVGVSVRRYGVERVGFNCATCHTSRIEGAATILVGAPADQLDLQAYLRFLIQSSQDKKFTPAALFAAAEQNGRPVGWLDRFVVTYVVMPRITSELSDYASDAGGWMVDRPDHGPGRTDAGNPWRQKFGMKPKEDALTGAVDMPSLWNQRMRKDVGMHWDGNNTSLAERNLSAALAGGASEESLDHASINRVATWALDLQSPRYPAPISNEMVVQGRALYAMHCAACHDVSGTRFGQVLPIAEVGTDRDRSDLFSTEMVKAFGNVGKGKPWQFTHYRKTDGYVNAPLDGIWARAPYLHNGSVPTLDELLRPADQRVKRFYKGCADFDPAHVGKTCRSGFVFDTSLRGNGNGGHSWGTQLSAAERAALLEFLKTL